jgi:hypothetical protein
MIEDNSWGGVDEIMHAFRVGDEGGRSCLGGLCLSDQDSAYIFLAGLRADLHCILEPLSPIMAATATEGVSNLKCKLA